MELRDGLIEELKPKLNDIGIIGDTNLCRLIGFHEDDDDFYYHVLYMNGHNRHSDKNDVYFSMVGRFETLKGVLPEESYKRMESTFSLNGAPPSKEFIISKD